MKVTLAIFALATAAAAQGDGGDSSQSQGDQSQGDQSQAAAQPQESYGNDGYAEQSYGSTGMYMKAPEVCLGNCPAEAPCQHPGGGCMPKACSAPVQYAAQNYGETQQSGYRHLQQGSQQQGYGQQQQSYGGPVAYATQVSAPAPNCGCPAGTVDMSCSRLGSRVVLWIAFALLFLPALWFFFASWNSDPLRLLDESEINADLIAEVENHRLHRLVAGVVCFIASLAYLTMSLGYGYTVRCCDGRQFYYARYVDWTITTPLMLWEIVDYTNAPHNERIFLLFMDVLMIIGGLIGALVCGGEKWAFFGFSILCFIPILWFLCALEAQVKDRQTRIFRSIMNLTVLSWFFYPIVWILAEGTGVLCANAEAICYTVLDIISKTVFGFLIVNHPFTVLEKAVQPAGNSML
jgi:bacteriorhodopsin